MPLDLLVPALLSPSASARLRFAEKWLARADLARHPATSAHAWLADVFGLDALPAAALGGLAETGAADGTWMRADPVHLAVQGDAVRLADASQLEMSDDEARELVAALQSHFAGDGIAFHVAAPDRWYMRLPGSEAPRTTALGDAIGRNVFGLLPEDKWWRSAITEAQMILSGHEVNARREAAGRAAVNSVWFWGGGSLPPRGTQRYATVWADDVVARGLGHWSGAEVRELPTGIEALDLARESDSVLAFVDDRVPAQALDDKWFQPLASAIERFDRVRLVLPASTATLVATLTGAARWRWFRGARPLSAYA